MQLRENTPQKNTAKLNQVLQYIVEKKGELPQEDVLNSLLYFIDFDYYERYEEQLMGMEYVRKNGCPIIKGLTSLLKALPQAKAELPPLSEQELEIIDIDLTDYGYRAAFQLNEWAYFDVPLRVTKEG